MKAIRLSLLALALAVSAATASETPPDADTATVKKALDRFKADFDTADIDFKLDAVKNLGKVQHPSIASALLRELKKSEDPHVRAAAIDGLGNQYSSAKKAGGQVLKVLQDSGEEPRVVLAGVRAIGKLTYDNKKSKDLLTNMMDRDEDEIVAEVFGVYGAWKDDSGLEKMLTWWEFWRDEKDFQTVKVTVDTGTAGSGDQKAAEKKGRAARSKLLAWRHRPVCTKALRTALTEITGVGFVRPEDLRAYMENPDGYRDPTKVAERLSEDQRREVYVAYQNVLSEAMRITDERKPEDPSDKAVAEERGKIYKGEVYKGRTQLGKERDLTVSELLVVRDEGDEKEWPKK